MPLDFVTSVLVSTGLTGALSALAYRRDVLTWDGSLAAFVVGMVIGVFGDVTWLFLLLFFLLSNLARMWNLIPTMPSAPVYVLIPVAIGFLGCQLDSVLGATLERRGLVSKKTVNLVSTTTGAIVAYAILIAAGPLPTA